VVIGLDGVPYTYIQRLFQAGELPNFRAIVGEGALVQMDTTSPKQEVFINTWLHDAG
jgi:predicted AlkP superfamily phosphohydrolase/phosphomutase